MLKIQPLWKEHPPVLQAKSNHNGFLGWGRNECLMLRKTHTVCIRRSNYILYLLYTMLIINHYFTYCNPLNLLGISFLPLLRFFYWDLGTVRTVWYFFFILQLTKNRFQLLLHKILSSFFTHYHLTLSLHANEMSQFQI